LLAKLGRGVACPHGNLTEVESPASRRRRGLLLLSEAEVGKNYIVNGIYERDRRLLEFLEAQGIRPRAKLSLLQSNYDKTLSIRTNARTVVLGRPAADRVWVSPLRYRSS
jgi:Fe2+ transport system protein FeoA